MSCSLPRAGSTATSAGRWPSRSSTIVLFPSGTAISFVEQASASGYIFPAVQLLDAQHHQLAQQHYERVKAAAPVGGAAGALAGAVALGLGMRGFHGGLRSMRTDYS